MDICHRPYICRREMPDHIIPLKLGGEGRGKLFKSVILGTSVTFLKS